MKNCLRCGKQNAGIHTCNPIREPKETSADELLKCPIGKCKNIVRKYDKYCRKHSARFARTDRFDLKTTKEKLLERIKIDNITHCWIYTGFKNELGYGRLRYKTKKELAHRLSYKFHKGRIPAGLLVCHSCDNPSCINPDHLFIGSFKDNMKDMFSKDRQPDRRGEKHPVVKLNNEQVIAIREQLKKGIKQNILARKYNVSPSTISVINCNKTWKHI